MATTKINNFDLNMNMNNKDIWDQFFDLNMNMNNKDIWDQFFDILRRIISKIPDSERNYWLKTFEEFYSKYRERINR
jgi:hypothetical protein